MSQTPAGDDDARAEAIRAILPSLPVPLVVGEALLGPLLPGSSKHRQVFAAQTAGMTLEHLRFDAAKGMHDINEVRAARRSDFALAPWIAEPTIYAGAYSDHFGHMLAENMHRLWAAAVYPALKGARIAFQLREGARGGRPPWFVELLALYGHRARAVAVRQCTNAFRRTACSQAGPGTWRRDADRGLCRPVPVAADRARAAGGTRPVRLASPAHV